MIKTIKTHCVNGALVPADAGDAAKLQEGQEYLVTVNLAWRPDDPEERLRLFKSTAGALREQDAYWEEWVKELHAEKIRAGSPTPPEE